MAVLRVLMLGVFLAGCSGSVPTPPPSSGNKAGGELINGTWQFQYSPGMAASPTKNASGWQFDFPGSDGVHYLVTGVGGLAPGKKSIKLIYEIAVSGSPTFQFRTSSENTCPTPLANVSLYMQRKGDDMSGAGPYANYRFWSRPALSELKAGPGSLTVSLSADQWINVSGQHSGIDGAINDLQALGMTFGGGCFAGHGVYVTGGTARFSAKSYSVD